MLYMNNHCFSFRSRRQAAVVPVYHKWRAGLFFFPNGTMTVFSLS
jgi:hypothetical protein